MRKVTDPVLFVSLGDNAAKESQILCCAQAEWWQQAPEARNKVARPVRAGLGYRDQIERRRCGTSGGDIIEIAVARLAHNALESWTTSCFFRSASSSVEKSMRR